MGELRPGRMCAATRNWKRSDSSVYLCSFLLSDTVFIYLMDHMTAPIAVMEPVAIILPQRKQNESYKNSTSPHADRRTVKHTMVERKFEKEQMTFLRIFKTCRQTSDKAVETLCSIFFRVLVKNKLSLLIVQSFKKAS